MRVSGTTECTRVLRPVSSTRIILGWRIDLSAAHGSVLVGKLLHGHGSVAPGCLKLQANLRPETFTSACTKEKEHVR